MLYLTLGSVWKQENDYALDFIKYHKGVGVEKFMILDREYHSLKALIGDDPAVEIIHFPDTPENIHSMAWAKLVGLNKGKTKWLALIDADQVLVPAKANDIKEILRDYEAFASLQCNWHTFGDAGQMKKEPGSLYERFLMRAKAGEGINNHTQTICQPDRTIAMKSRDPHHLELPPHEISVNTNKQKVEGPFNKPPLHDILWIAHYISKSKEEWANKNNKGRADIFNQKMPFEMFDQHASFCNEEQESRVLDLWNQRS